MRRPCLFILFLLFLAPRLLYAQTVYTVTPTKEPVRVGNKFVFLRDSTDNMQLNEAFSSNRYKENNEDVPNFDVTADAVWGKAKFTCNEAQDWYLDIYPSIFDEITFYQRKGNGPWKELKTGNGLPLENNKIPIGHFLLNLDLTPGDTTVVMLRIHDAHPLQFDIKTGTIESFLLPFHNTDLYNGICFGVMIMMLLYNLYLFFVQKERIYIYYVMYLLCSMAFLFTFVGYFFHLPYIFRFIILKDQVFFPASFGIFLLLFTQKLFKGFLTRPVFIAHYIMMGLVITDTILCIIPGYSYFAFSMIRILGLLLGAICMTSGIVALRKGSTSARYYILGFGAYLSGLAFLIISGHLIPANSVALMALITGSMLESVFLSFAQADKLKFMQLEKEKAQHETLIQAKENERLVTEQNVVLEQKVQQRTAELAEKNKEVLDSIHYAKRIQNTLLTHQGFLKQNLPEHFILFKPKDIVSGDFYWAAKKGNRLYLAVCDSTGHGVPGAFMSLLNITFLNEAINEKNIVAPNEVLNHVRTRLIENISRDGGRDGMDGILACLEQNGDKIKLSYAAAYNEPILVRNNSFIELGADKMPVGQAEQLDSFTRHEIELQKGDVLYLATDGYADQFGGPNGKKFKYKQLLEKLLALSQQPLDEQAKKMDKTFEEWRGNLEQIDDVLVIGLKI